MCTFCQTSDLPSHDKGNLRANKGFISYFLKPNNENEQYRLRLLFYRQPNKNDRKDPYILQKIHDHWGLTQKGLKIVDDFIICPGTDYVHYDEDKFVLNTKTNKKELNCPICQKSRDNFSAYTNSGKTDKISLLKGYQLKAKERLCAPVYVINDPNNKQNNGTFKVLILTNPDDIKIFQKTIEEERTKAYLSSKEGNNYEIFNGGNAVDLYIRVEIIPEVKNQGKNNEYVSQVRKITKIAFGKNTQPISDINKEAIDKFGFDDQFYVSNTKNELEAFYKKYYGQNDITPDEEDVFGSSTPQPVKHDINTENNIIQEQTVSDGELDSIVDNPISELSNETEDESAEGEIPTDLDSLLDDI